MIIFSQSSDDTEIVLSLESLTQAGIIFIMALAIIITNVLIIATLVNFRGKCTWKRIKQPVFLAASSMSVKEKTTPTTSLKYGKSLVLFQHAF